MGEELGVEQLCSGLEELHQLLHESQERESVAVEEVQTMRTKADNLREEVKQIEEQSTLEQEYAQAKLELKIERAVQQEGCKWQEIEGKLISELAEAKKQLSESKDSVKNVSSDINGSPNSVTQAYISDSVGYYNGAINTCTVTAGGSHVGTQVVNSSSMPTWPQNKSGTHIFPHVSWEWPSSSSSAACSGNTSVGNNAPVHINLHSLFQSWKRPLCTACKHTGVKHFLNSHTRMA